MKAAKLSKLGLAAGVWIACCGTIGSANASIFGQPAPEQSPEVEQAPEVQAASQRVEQTKAKLDQAKRQLDAAKASLRAADAEFRAARADKEALALRKEAEQLASRVPGEVAPAPAANTAALPGRLNPSDRIDASSVARSGAPPVSTSTEPPIDYLQTDQTAAPAQ